MDIEKIIGKEKFTVDEICDYFNYDDNIRHLLYLIIPAFVIKYGVNREDIIIRVFRNTAIHFNYGEGKNRLAFYFGNPVIDGNNVNIRSGIVVNNYRSISLVNLLDSLIHEFNHAVISFNNAISFKENKFFVRTGISYIVYDKDSLAGISKEDSYVLEEIINTRQTQDIIEIIKGFSNFKGTDVWNDEIRNAVYSINGETHDKYESMAYYLESYVCRGLLDNRTFISTMESLRFSGNIQDIPEWFDNIVGEVGVYNKFIIGLKSLMDLDLVISNKSIFKRFKINKLRNVSREVIDIVNRFNNNSNYS